MANQAVIDLTAQVTRATTVSRSATVLIEGIQARITAAVEAALANGATAEELAPLTTLATELDAQSAALAAAVQANTPASNQPV